MRSLFALDKLFAFINMYSMVVTLETLKLSGWLNADASRNMPCMVVTLEVSRLSGWLNADA
jgi:hypothetical protein